MTKRIVVVPDLQIPYHDRKALKALVRFIGDTQPDEVLMIGDVLDFPQPSRWNKDTRGEFEGSIYEDVQIAQRDLFDPLRASYTGPVKFIEGNHDERPRVYLEKYSPALAGTRAFDMDVLCDFESYRIETVGPFYDVAPGWVATHGHKGGIRINQIAGNTAMGAARKFGKSVVMGHTHRLGIISHTTGYDGKVDKTLTGMEVGNLMDQKLAGYLKGGTANWQRGFGVLEIDGRTVNPSVVPIIGNRFTVDGHTWGL